MEYLNSYKIFESNWFKYDTGKYKIFSTQTSYDQEKVDKIYQAISNNKYDFNSPKGIIAGYIHNDKYYITEGHHRILAALKYWRRYNDYKPVDNMIQNGIFTKSDKKPIGNRRLPSKLMEKVII